MNSTPKKNASAPLQKKVSHLLKRYQLTINNNLLRLLSALSRRARNGDQTVRAERDLLRGGRRAEA